MKTSRRLFIQQSSKAGLGIVVASGLAGAILPACSSVKKGMAATGGGSLLKTGFKQDPLAYSYTALDKAIDAVTMEIHYSRHAAAYASNLQDAAKAENADTNQPLENLLAKISKYSPKMRNNGGGHYNHELFWKCMSPDGGGQPGGKLLADLQVSFNSFDAFKTQLADAGKNRFGSGWAWLFVDGDKKLRIGSTPNQDNPLMDLSEIKGQPLLGLDVWEHAYYLRYQNKRADYINAWWNVVNWKYVEERYKNITG